MSNEDLRISNVDGETAPHEFLSDIREDAKPVEVERVELAQAASSEQTPKTGRVEATPPAPANANPNEVVADQNNVAHLPANVSLDDIHIEGSNLVLVQADGTEIVIVNGALHVPSFMLGDVELPRDTVIAALNDSKINVAAGPDGTDTATAAAPSSGAEFQDTLQPGDDAPTQLAQLLADTQQPDPTLGGTQEFTNDVPTITTTQLLTLTEAANAEGGFAQQTVNGQFGFNGGADVGVITAVNYTGSTDVDEEGGTAGKPVSGLTSGGHDVTVTVNGLTITGTITIGEGAEAKTITVFELKVTDTSTGAFTFTQYGPLDHPDQGQSGASDALGLNFSYTVTDKDGDAVTGNASIDIRDDGPSINLGEANDNSAVSEHDLLSGNVVTGNISLGVQWGADSGANRDLTFDKQNAPEGLTSHGLAIQYEVSADGHTLTGYTVSGEGQGAVRTDVFVVTLHPSSAHGDYTFQLLTSIDHPQGGTPSQDAQVDLAFNVTASDADGDTVGSAFTVSINDDVPTASFSGTSTITEDGVNGVFTPQTATGTLVFNGGADGATVTDLSFRTSIDMDHSNSY
ncbi:hypothetical protein HGP14_04970, partial [Rhizobium sp. P32RR-XVIII]|uniref:T1SS-143 repeat domain-containing protein n=1 Tax=Rhizobium sp. P32RR-XVIII TaxID=2726738 RepID=UPI0017E25AE8|nr:hypothetical protein [Rhizobium sp. P32RR-XVIII]